MTLKNAAAGLAHGRAASRCLFADPKMPRDHKGTTRSADLPTPCAMRPTISSAGHGHRRDLHGLGEGRDRRSVGLPRELGGIRSTKSAPPAGPVTCRRRCPCTTSACRCAARAGRHQGFSVRSAQHAGRFLANQGAVLGGGLRFPAEPYMIRRAWIWAQRIPLKESGKPVCDYARVARNSGARCDRRHRLRHLDSGRASGMSVERTKRAATQDQAGGCRAPTCPFTDRRRKKFYTSAACWWCRTSLPMPVA